MGTFDSFVFDQEVFDPKSQLYGASVYIYGTAPVEVSQDFETTIISTSSKSAIFDFILAQSWVTHAMDVLIIAGDESLQRINPLINAVYTSVIYESEKALIRAQQINDKFRIDSATGIQLDDYFGRVLELRRHYNESDADYIRRLRTHIAVLTSSGTKNDCLKIIDSIMGFTNSATLEVSYPAQVAIRWNNVTIKNLAVELDSVLNEIFNKMFAIGVTWKTVLEYVEYDMDSKLEGIAHVDYLVNTLIEQHTLYYYLQDTYIAKRGIVTYEAGTAIDTTHEMPYFMMAVGFGKIGLLSEYLMKSEILGTHVINQLINTIIEIHKTEEYDYSSIIEKCYILSDFDADVIVSKRLRRFYYMSVTLVGE